MTLHDEWLDRLYRLRHFGAAAGPRGQGTLEQLDQRIHLVDSTYGLLDVPTRRLNFRFAVAEFIWMWFGHSDVESIARYNSVMRQFSDDGVFLTGAYGPHIKAQLPRALRKLKEDPFTRQAVVQIPRPLVATKDEPCTLSLQFLLRNNYLHLIVTMRSSDVWLGVPYDTFTFTMFQNVVAGILGVRRGWFTLNAGSSHLYCRDIPAADVVLASTEARTLPTPDMPGAPPPWMEDVLLNPAGPNVVNTVMDSPWAPFARVLQSDSNAAARDVLLGFWSGGR